VLDKLSASQYACARVAGLLALALVRRSIGRGELMLARKLLQEALDNLPVVSEKPSTGDQQ
jgi:hypothetical protein